MNVDWRHEAACRDTDPDLFFPVGDTGPALMQAEVDFAVDTHQKFGIWGGLTADQLKSAKRRRQRARAAS